MILHIADNKPSKLSLSMCTKKFRDPFGVQRKIDERNSSPEEYSGVYPTSRTSVAHDSQITLTVTMVSKPLSTDR